MKTTIFIFSHKNININKISHPNLVYLGVGDGPFSEDFEVANKFQNINHKHFYYGELVGQYYIWKNYIIKNINCEEWVGFGQYRRYFLQKHSFKNYIYYNKYSDLIVKKIFYKSVILTSKFNLPLAQYFANLLHQFFDNTVNPKISLKKLSKTILKNVNISNNYESILTHPILIPTYDIKKQYIESHNISDHVFSEILKLMDKNMAIKFTEYLKKKNFSAHNMFISKPKIIDKYFTFLFDLYEKIENILDDRSNEKITKNHRFFSHLSERLCDFWFKTYTKNYTLPIGFCDEI